MTQLVQNPFVPILSLTGQGLNMGHVYIGVVNEDPQTNPQATYWDEGLTIPAMQPLDVLGGYIMREGTPAQAFTASAYSIRVLDHSGVQVFYQTDATSVLDLKLDIDLSNPNASTDQKAAFRAYIGADQAANINYLPPWGVAAIPLSTRLEQYVSVLDSSAVKADGETDDSVAIMNLINANKGKTILFPAGYTYLAGGLILSGSTYNNTTLVIAGTLRLTVAAGSNFQSTCWAGIVVHNCDGVTVDVPGVIDGNRANQPASEFIFCLVIAGATNYRVPNFNCQEIRGDGIFISQATLGSASAVPTNGYIGPVTGHNSADDGRNLISIISAKGLMIQSVLSYQIGGTIAGTLEPGGVDIEPDFGYHTVSNITIGPCIVTTAGTFGFGIAGKAITNDATRDWCVSDINVGPLTIFGTSTGTTGPTAFGGAAFSRVKNLSVAGTVTRGTETGPAWSFDFIDGLRADVRGQNCQTVCVVGFNDYVNDFHINVSAPGFSAAAVIVSGVNNGRFTGVEISPAGAGSYGVQTALGGHTTSVTQSNVRYSIDVPYSAGNLSAAFLSAAEVVYEGCLICDCSFAGYTNYASQVAFGSAIASRNIYGRNNASSIPTDGNWFRGDFVANDLPAVATGKALLGWSRLTTGAGNVAGTDWTPVYGTTT